MNILVQIIILSCLLLYNNAQNKSKNKNRLEKLIYVDNFTDICMLGKKHKRKPSAEPFLSGNCEVWKERSCCHYNVSEEYDAKNTAHGFSYDHCGDRKMSEKCLNHFHADLCLYECSPDLGPWLVKINGMKMRQERFYQAPLCKSDCQQWWADCRDEYTCVANWVNGFTWKNGIVRILGMNPSPMTLQGTNSYLIGQPPSKNRLLIDTSSPNIKDYVENLRQYFSQNEKNQFHISDILLTHWHDDHIGSLSAVMEFALSQNWPLPKVHKFSSLSHPNCLNCEVTPIKPDQIFDLSSFGMGNLKVLYSPGHTDDHLCFLLTPENILFSADLILGHGSTVFENLSLYMDSLNEIKKLENSLEMILPGHGLEILTPKLKIAEYVKHRSDRIEEVLRALSPKNWQWENDIVKKVYAAEILENKKLFFGALSNQFQALEYLVNQDKVESRDPTDSEKDSPASEFSLSGKLWRLKNKKSANL